MSIQRDENRLRNGTTAVNLTPRVHIDFFFFNAITKQGKQMDVTKRISRRKWKHQHVTEGRLRERLL